MQSEIDDRYCPEVDYSEHDEPPTDPVRKSETKDTTKLFVKLYDIHPDCFAMKQYSEHWYRKYDKTMNSTSGSSTADPFPVLKVEPNLAGTWFSPSLKQTSDSVETWPLFVKLPPPPPVT